MKHDLPAEVCEDSLEGWGYAHGLDQRQINFLLSHGFTSYNQLQALLDVDQKMVLDGLSLRSFLKDMFFKVLTAESADLYAEHCFRGTTVKEYRRSLFEKQTAKSPPECGVAGPVNKRDWEGANASPTTTMFHPGLNLVPHKVVVLDRAKALRNDPSLTMECFLSLVDDDIALPTKS